MDKNTISSILLRALRGNRRKTIKSSEAINKYLSHKGYIEAVTKAMERKCGHPCEIELDLARNRVHIKNSDKLITKSTLAERWSPKLIEKYFYKPTMTLKNPNYSCAAPMCLYAMSEVKRKEKSREFKKDFDKVRHIKVKSYRRKVARKTADLLGIQFSRKS